MNIHKHYVAFFESQISRIIFSPIRPPRGLFPVLGPLERYYDTYT